VPERFWGVREAELDGREPFVDCQALRGISPVGENGMFSRWELRTLVGWQTWLMSLIRSLQGRSSSYSYSILLKSPEDNTSCPPSKMKSQ